MFSEGFEKSAAVREVGRAAGKFVSAPFKALGAAGLEAARGARRGAKGFAEGLASGLPMKRLSPSMKVKPERGAGLAYKHVSREARQGKLPVSMPTAYKFEKEKVQQKMKERLKKIKEGPSFVSKHPLLSAVGAYAGYKYLTSPSDDKTPEPQVYRPSY